MIRISLFTRRLIYLMLIASVLLILYAQLHAREAYWLMWSGFLFSLITPENVEARDVPNCFGLLSRFVSNDDGSRQMFFEYLWVILATALLSLSGVLLTSFLSNLPYLLMLFVFVVTFACAYAKAYYPFYRFAFFIVNLFIILSAIFVANSNDINARLLFMAQGMAVVVGLQCLIWPGFKKSESLELTKLALRNLCYLNQDIFACFLERNYADNQYFYERRLHVQKVKFMAMLTLLRKFDTKVVEKLNNLYEILLDCALLRGRVSDFSIFEVCQHELKTVDEEISKLLAYPLTMETELLLDAIDRLEENYQQVLLVTAKEPLPFLLLIASLRAFSRAIVEMKR